MSKLYAYGAVTLFIASCAPSPPEPIRLEHWYEYKSPESLKGLQVKPVDVQYEVGHIYINGRGMDAPSAIETLKQSRNLSPAPDIVVTVNGSLYLSAVPFLKAISDADLCREVRCWIKTAR